MDSNSIELALLELLKSYGLDSHKSLVKIQGNGHVLMPV